MHFEVVQDYGVGGRGEKIVLGQVTLNLAQYVEESDAIDTDDDGVMRRYLMQESKINSTLKIGIGMRQVDGERNYIAPPLNTAPVFGGITGIMANEEVANEDGREYFVSVDGRMTLTGEKCPPCKSRATRLRCRICTECVWRRRGSS